MNEDTMSFDLPIEDGSIIKVIGIGGGGNNAVNHMSRQGIKDVDFIVCNTDSQALDESPVSNKIQIGASLTEGRGAGNNPEIGKQAAIENLDDMMNAIGGQTKMVFITAGMGGGTGTGGAPVLAKATKEAGLLTVAIVTIPFRFEGKKRHEQAIEGLEELANHVDSLLVINNEKLREIYGNLKISEAFSKADDVLSSAAKGIAEIVTVPGYINVDFADVQTVMRNSGMAIMGSAKADGENRAIEAVKNAVMSPLLNNNDIQGADNILLNITSGTDEVTMDEITEVTDFVSDAVGKDALIIWGTGKDEELGSTINVTIIATGFEANIIPELYTKRSNTQKVPLNSGIRPNKNQPKEMAHIEEPQFEVKDKQKDDQFEEELFQASQQSINFEYEQEEEESSANEDIFQKKRAADNPEKAAERMQHLKENTKLKDNNYSLIDKKNIEELENEPAYIRKKIKISQTKHSANRSVSRYSLFDDEKSGKSKLNSDNSYLHDNVD